MNTMGRKGKLQEEDSNVLNIARRKKSNRKSRRVMLGQSETPQDWARAIDQQITWLFHFLC